MQWHTNNPGYFQLLLVGCGAIRMLVMAKIMAKLEYFCILNGPCTHTTLGFSKLHIGAIINSGQ